MNKVIGLYVISFGLVLIGLSFVDFSDDPMVSVAPAPISTTVSATETVVPTQELIPTITITPLAPLVKGYLLGEQIDLSNKSNTALTIRLDENNLLPGNWAEALSFKEENLDEVFAPKLGTIYSYSIRDNATILAAHSGTFNGKPSLFASSIDLYVRKEDGVLLNLGQGLEKTQSLVGKTAFICQTEAGGIKKMSLYDVTLPCPGRQLELRIVSASFIPQEQVVDYDANFFRLSSWLTETMPGFQMDPTTSFLLVTCVGRYPDQTSIATIPDYDFNRLVLAFKVIPLGE